MLLVSKFSFKRVSYTAYWEIFVFGLKDVTIEIISAFFTFFKDISWQF